jgi:SAM-dependent methyltransferase
MFMNLRAKKIARKALRIAMFKPYILHHRFLHWLCILPFSRSFGWESGTPVGRYYVEQFLRRNSHLVQGRCLEFGSPRYKSFFPLAGAYEVVSISEAPGVDHVCDIHDIGSMPEGVFDSIICTQVFEHLAFPERAAASLLRLLKPGGVALVTAPFINPVHYEPTDYRRFTPDGLRLVLESAGLVVEEVDFGGNSLVGTGSLLGMVQEDFTLGELERKDPVYPYNVLIRARRPN